MGVTACVVEEDSQDIFSPMALTIVFRQVRLGSQAPDCQTTYQFKGQENSCKILTSKANQQWTLRNLLLLLPNHHSAHDRWQDGGVSA
jgi:hypothetical protein